MEFWLDQHNPYIDEEGNPILRKSVVAFIDILGYTEAMRQSIKNGKSQDDLNIIKSAFSKALKHLLPEERVLAENRFPFGIKIIFR